jgi:uncharacterized protein YjbI with pentapeptide repeats
MNLCKLSEVKLSEVKLSEVKLSEVKLSEVKLSEVKISEIAQEKQTGNRCEHEHGYFDFKKIFELIRGIAWE